jgi:hypothetical protein
MRQVEGYNERIKVDYIRTKRRRKNKSLIQQVFDLFLILDFEKE